MPGLFRQSALNKLSSPERLDVMMKVTSPAGWLALSGLGLAIILIIFWSIIGSISIRVRGNGILMRGREVLAVTSGSNGRLLEILVEQGDNVKEGQAVARLSQSDLQLRIEHTQEELQELMGQSEQQRRSQAGILAQLQRQRNEQNERIEQLQQALDKGLITPGQLLQAKQELTSIDQRIAETRMTDASRSNRIAEVRRQLKELESELENSSTVVSPYPGRVLELTATPGDLIGTGGRIVTLESFEKPIEAVIYVPAADGKRVQPGMEVLISPSTIRAEEYGFIIGTVRDVSDYPVSPEGLLRVLRNQSLVNQLTGSGAPIEVAADLVEDAATPSGFKWSSSKGPPSKVFSGTICTASVSVERKRPISYVLPIFRKAIGVGG